MPEQTDPNLIILFPLLEVSQQLVAEAVAVEGAVALADDAGLVDGVLKELAEVCFFHDDLAFVSVLPAMVQCW